MPIDFGPLFRRLLLTAGIPMLSLSCAEEGGKPAGRCVGEWGTSETTGGCRSGPYTTTVEAFLELNEASAQQLAFYEQCLVGESCPETLCLDLIGYQPKSGVQIQESFDTLVTCEPACTDGKHRGVHVVYKLNGSCTGRRPEGLTLAEALPSLTETGAFFAEAAQLEGASVAAFGRLARELASHGAPAALVTAARRSMREEARHFKTMRTLATRFGAKAQRPSVTRGGVRSLEVMALENVTEGCVVETFGAVVGAWQGAASVDATVRAAMTQIAADEMAHATLSWQVDAWARAQLDQAANRRLDSARDAKLASLATNVANAEVSDELANVAGVPRALVQKSLFEEVRRQLWDQRPAA